MLARGPVQVNAQPLLVAGAPVAPAPQPIAGSPLKT
jgi:hypothetical protein